MKDYNKNEYLKFLLYKTKFNLSRFDISQRDLMLVNSLFEKLIYSNNLVLDLFILSNVKGLKSMGKYFVYVLKKLEDNAITFDNLSQNIKSDSEFIESEILNFLSNPGLKENITLNFIKREIETYDRAAVKHDEQPVHDSDLKQQAEETEEEPESDSDTTDFKKHYLELIQSESSDSEIAYELPSSEKKNVEEFEDEYKLPEKEPLSEEIVFENSEKISLKDEEEEISIEDDELENDFEEPEIVLESETDTEEETPEETFEEKDINNESAPRDRIPLSTEIQDEISSMKEDLSTEEHETYEEIEEIEEFEQIIPEEPTNAVFAEYEKEIMEKNAYLSGKFDQMIFVLEKGDAKEKERAEIIYEIMNTGIYLENLSRRMSLEIISGIYQSIYLSFEKIADGKYDISEGTINLFKKGLLLVISLIKGDDYFGYKDILKSIENIKNALLEEKEKREEYIRRKQERIRLEKTLDEKYSDVSQKPGIVLLKQLVKDTDAKFKNLENISGEYQIYEALRSLSGALGNLKEMVRLSQELNMKQVIHLAEGSYVFVKFLQNYRINPVTIEIKEIFGYIIYNFKLLVVGRPVEDLELFISYLNDPVKIFSKTEMKKS